MTSRRLVRVSLLAVLGIVLGYYTLFLIDYWHAYQASWAPSTRGAGAALVYPSDMDDFVSRSDLIFAGQVVSVTFLGYSVRGYDTAGALSIAYTRTGATALVTAIATPVGHTGAATVYQRVSDVPGIPYTDYTVRVDRVFLGAPGITPGDRVVVRVTATPDDGFPAGDIAPSGVGDAFVFAVAAEPDRKAYGLVFGAASRLDLSGSRVRISNVARAPIPFTAPTEVSAFITALESVIAASSKAPTSNP